jgi:hypothetical protein
MTIERLLRNRPLVLLCWQYSQYVIPRLQIHLERFSMDDFP